MSPRPSKEFAIRLEAERAMTFAQRLEDGWEFYEELRLEGRLPLIKGRRFQLEEMAGILENSGKMQNIRDLGVQIQKVIQEVKLLD